MKPLQSCITFILFTGFFITILLTYVYFVAEIAIGVNQEEIYKDWEWISKNLFKVLNEMECEEEITNFTICKIKSLYTQNNQDESGDSADFKVNQSKFRQYFNMPEEEQLVNYYSCT